MNCHSVPPSTDAKRDPPSYTSKRSVAADQSVMSKATSDVEVQVHLVASARVAAPGVCSQPPVKKSPAAIVLLAQTQLPSNTSGMEMGVACADGAANQNAEYHQPNDLA